MPKKNRVERLFALIEKFNPEVSVETLEKGEWGKEGPPYFFDNLPDGRQRLRIVNRETGDQIGVVGSSRDELLDKLEARLS